MRFECFIAPGVCMHSNSFLLSFMRPFCQVQRSNATRFTFMFIMSFGHATMLNGSKTAVWLACTHGNFHWTPSIVIIESENLFQNYGKIWVVVCQYNSNGSGSLRCYFSRSSLLRGKPCKTYCVWCWFVDQFRRFRMECWPSIYCKHTRTRRRKTESVHFYLHDGTHYGFKWKITREHHEMQYKHCNATVHHKTHYR